MPTRDWLHYYSDFVIYPALLIGLVLADVPSIGPVWLLWFAIGFIAWTFAEYVIHRWVLHGPYWMAIHQRHHEHPREHVLFPIWQLPYVHAAYAGIILGWIGFFVMHHLMHHIQDLRPYPWLQDFAIRHNAHHKLTDRNYGITVDWWDRVFRTKRVAR